MVAVVEAIVVDVVDNALCLFLVDYLFDIMFLVYFSFCLFFDEDYIDKFDQL